MFQKNKRIGLAKTWSRPHTLSVGLFSPLVRKAKLVFASLCRWHLRGDDAGGGISSLKLTIPLSRQTCLGVLFRFSSVSCFSLSILHEGRLVTKIHRWPSTFKSHQATEAISRSGSSAFYSLVAHSFLCAGQPCGVTLLRFQSSPSKFQRSRRGVKLTQKAQVDF